MRLSFISFLYWHKYGTSFLHHFEASHWQNKSQQSGHGSKIDSLFWHYCPKYLTFPKAEHDQLCPRLVVVFCLFFSICQSDLLFAGVNQSNSVIEINKQKMTTTKRGHRWSRSAFGKVRFLGHLFLIFSGLIFNLFLNLKIFTSVSYLSEDTKIYVS